MKYITLLLLLFSQYCIFGQNLAAKDSLTILLVLEKWNKGWQTKDYDLAASCYSEDARFTNAFGDKRNGQEEIKALLKEVFALPFVMAGSSETITNLFQPLNSTLVIVHTAVVRKGQKMPDGSVLADRKTTHMMVFQKIDDHWVITAHLISDARDKQMAKH